jgi:FkbM family methyltransferase
MVSAPAAPSRAAIPVDRDRHVERVGGTVIVSERYGIPVRFFVTEPRDTIQSKHHRGKFYEEDELLALAEMLPQGLRILDVGANVGNHALFFSIFMGADRIVSIEPNPAAAFLMETNLRLNRVENVETIVGLALSDGSGAARLMPVAGNLGGTQVLALPDAEAEADDAAIRTVKGDDIVAGRHFDFIKMDVEGMEVPALHGLGETIARCRPLVMAEIVEETDAGFRGWLADARYRIRHAFEHPDMVNYLAEPL